MRLFSGFTEFIGTTRRFLFNRISSYGGYAHEVGQDILKLVWNYVVGKLIKSLKNLGVVAGGSPCNRLELKGGVPSAAKWDSAVQKSWKFLASAILHLTVLTPLDIRSTSHTTRYVYYRAIHFYRIEKGYSALLSDLKKMPYWRSYG